MELQPFSREKLQEPSDTPLPSRQATQSAWYSQLFFCWVWRLVLTAKREIIQSSNLFRLPKDLKAKSETLSSSLESRQLLAGIFASEKKYLYLSLFVHLFASTLMFTGPVYIKIMADYLLQDERSTGKGFFWLATFACLTFLGAVMQTFSRFIDGLIENRVRNSLCTVIFQKTLRVQSVPEGMGVNLMQVDAKKIYECFAYLGVAVSMPLELCLALALMFHEVGTGALPGLGCFAGVMLLNYLMSIKIKQFNEQQMQLKDKRMEVSKLVFSEIRMIKAYVWETFFHNRILEIRNTEMTVMRKLETLWSFNVFLLWAASPLATSAILLFHTQVAGQDLTAEKAFVVFSAISLLQEPLRALPFAIIKAIQAVVSARRIQSYLDIEELPPIVYATKTSFKGCTFSYQESDVLKDIDLAVEPGEFLGVVGSVGSGKSSLLHAVMGEVIAREGQVRTDSSLSYAPSLDSWLMNDTLRNNILMGAPFEEAWYWQVIEACGLKADLDILPGKDLVEIGEKGINLSGGQKARVNLARAVYANASTILLDDPLSSVDTHVAKHIFTNCFCNLLKTKTRILVTHRLEYIHKVDRVIQMEEGRIVSVKYPADLQIDADQETHSIREPIVESSEVHKIVVPEDKEAGQVRREVYLKYFAASGSVWYIVSAGTVMVLWMLTVIGGDISLKEWSENPQDPELMMFLYCILKIGGCIFIFLRCILVLVCIGVNASKSLHEGLIKNLLKVPVNLFYDITPTGRILNRLSKDQNEIDEDMAGLLGSFLVKICSLVGIVVVQLLYFPLLLVVLGPIVYLAFKVASLYLSAARELRRLESMSKSKVLSVFGECIAGLKFIRSFRKADYYLEKHFQVLDENTRASYTLISTQAWAMMNLGSLTSAFVVLVFGMIVVFRNYISAGAMGLTLSYGITLPAMVLWIVFTATEIEKTMISVERILAYTDIPQEQPYLLTTDSPSWPLNPTIEFKEVTLQYRPNSPFILNSLSFTVPAGHRVGIVGRTGSGKTSAFTALLRLVELTRGMIAIDGVNIAKVGLTTLRQAITLIPQDPIVFADTLRTNLDPRGMRDDQAVLDVLKDLRLDQFELGHEVKGRGSNLSVGERQLISIGRALLAHTKILLLDEATAGIDNAADKAIQEFIRHRFTDCTLLVIAHRLDTVMDSDLILVLDKGVLIEQGRPQDLAAVADSAFSGLLLNLAS